MTETAKGTIELATPQVPTPEVPAAHGASEQAVQRAVELAKAVGHVYIATADRHGLPHLAAGGGLTSPSRGRVAVAEWFCPGTLDNVQSNARISITVWNPMTDLGFQILGKVAEIDDLAVMDGQPPADELAAPMPQVERRLVVDVERVLDFTRRPHTDLEE